MESIVCSKIDVMERGKTTATNEFIWECTSLKYDNYFTNIYVATALVTKLRASTHWIFLIRHRWNTIFDETHPSCETKSQC